MSSVPSTEELRAMFARSLVAYGPAARALDEATDWVVGCGVAVPDRVVEALMTVTAFAGALAANAAGVPMPDQMRAQLAGEDMSLADQRALFDGERQP